MSIEVVRIIDAALQDATIGVAAVLDTWPLEDGDATPPNPTFYDETHDSIASREQMPDGAGPYVLTSSSTASGLNPATRPVTDYNVDVLIRYGIRDADTVTAFVTAKHTLAVIAKTLRSIVTTAAGEALRTRNQVQVIEVSNFQEMIFEAPQGDTLVSGGIRCTARYRDLR